MVEWWVGSGWMVVVWWLAGKCVVGGLLGGLIKNKENSAICFAIIQHTNFQLLVIQSCGCIPQYTSYTQYSFPASRSRYIPGC